MNSHILAGIRERDKLLSQFKRNKDSSVHEAYCKVQNSAQRDIKRPKANYFENKVKQSIGNSDKRRFLFAISITQRLRQI